MSTTGNTKDRTDTDTGAMQVPDAAPTPRTDFLGWLEAARTAADVSWAEISRRSGISENGLRRIRQGEVVPRPATVDALARALSDDLGMDADDVDAASRALHGIPARRTAGEATIWLTVGVAGGRAQRLDRETAGRLILFLEASARAWLATSDCTESD